MVVTSVPLKNSIAPVYPNANLFIYVPSHPSAVRNCLDFNSSPALTCGTHPCNCPSYPVDHLLKSHKKGKNYPSRILLSPELLPTPAQYAAAACPVRRRRYGRRRRRGPPDLPPARSARPLAFCRPEPATRPPCPLRA